jgi:hypothetical protein
MSSFNYEFDFYTWEKDIICAEYISKNMTQSAIKAAIKYAIENNDYENYPDSDSYASNTTEDFNEIHDTYNYDTYNYNNNYNDNYKNNITSKKCIKKKYFNWINCCFSKK